MNISQWLLFKKIPPHLWVAASGWVSRIIVIIGQLVSIPFFYHRLGMTGFAIFTVITAGFIPWCAMMDFGIGSTLQNAISEARAKNEDPAYLLSKIFPIIIALILIVSVFYLLLGGFLNSWLFSHLGNEIPSFYFSLAIAIYSSYYILLIANKIFFGYQKGGWGYFYQNIGYGSLLLMMGIIHFFGLNVNLIEAIYCWIIPLFISGFIGFIHAFYQAKVTHLEWKIDISFAKKTMPKAFQFWLYTLSWNGITAIDYFVIVKMLSAHEVVTYNIVNRIFIMMSYGYSAAVLNALWPVLAEKYIQNTASTLKAAQKELRNSLIGGIIYIIVMTIALILMRGIIVKVFRVQDAIELPVTLLLVFGLYGLIRVWTDTYAMVLQARNTLKIFLIQTPLQAAIAIGLMLWLSHYGLFGIVFALILSFVIIPLWILPLTHYRTLHIHKSGT